MRLLADEGIDQPIVARLRQEGYRVLYVAEMEPGIGDDAILQEAGNSGALLLTADKDFGEIVFRQRRFSAGIVLVRLRGLSPQMKAELVSAALREHGSELDGAFTVVAPGLVRVRHASPTTN